MRNAVVTVAVGNGLEWLEISEPTMRAYAKKLNAEFVALTDVTCPPFACGEKWQVFDMYDTYERILFLDADIIVRPTAPDLFRLVPEDRIGLYDDYADLFGWAWLYSEYEEIQKEQRFEVKPVPTCYNTGLVMASRGHREIWRQPNFFRPSHTYEQSLINLKIAEHGLPVFALDRRTHWQWWSDRGRGLDKEGQFLHYAGIKDHAERLILMREAAVSVSVEKDVVARSGNVLPPKKGCNCGNKKVMARKPI
jgi:hypothetical protein